MRAPNYVQKELRAIDSMYFAIYNPCILDRKSMSAGRGRWQIRKWIGVYPKRLDLWDTDASELIMTVCKEEVTDRGLIDVGYDEIDIRVIQAIRESHWWKLDYKRKIQELDWHNEKKERQANAQLDYESKYVAKRIWRSRHEPTVHQDGNWKFYKGKE